MAEINTRKRATPTDKRVGTQIRSRRLMLGLSQTALGDAVGVTFQQIQKYEKGINRVSASRMQQIAQVFDVPVTFFFEGAPVKTGTKTPAMPAYVTNFLSSHQGHKLMKAFARVNDRKLRKKMVVFAEQLAASSRTE